jgi:DNA-binding response OmpR family regulator
MKTNKQPLVLVVDDNPENLRVVAGTLEQAGLAVALALSAEEALLFLKDRLPDCVLLDIMMPHMDGLELCEQLKAKPHYALIPVIFLTAREELDDVLKGFTAGGVDYIVKPFNGAELIARVKTHIELKLAREEIRTLRGILPVCANCKKVRDHDNAWVPFEIFVKDHTEADISHGMCPHCLKQLYPEIADQVLTENGNDQ